MRKIGIYNFVAKGYFSKKYPQLVTVYHDPETKCAVASDGHILVSDPENYVEKFAGKLVSKDGNVKEYVECGGVKYRFPKYLPLLNPHKKLEIKYFTGWAEIGEAIKAYKELKKERGQLFYVEVGPETYISVEHAILIYRYFRGCKVYVSGIDNEILHFYINSTKCVVRTCLPDKYENVTGALYTSH